MKVDSFVVNFNRRRYIPRRKTSINYSERVCDSLQRQWESVVKHELNSLYNLYFRKDFHVCARQKGHFLCGSLFNITYSHYCENQLVLFVLLFRSLHRQSPLRHVVTEMQSTKLQYTNTSPMRWSVFAIFKNCVLKFKSS